MIRGDCAAVFDDAGRRLDCQTVRYALHSMAYGQAGFVLFAGTFHISLAVYGEQRMASSRKLFLSYTCAGTFDDFEVRKVLLHAGHIAYFPIMSQK